MKRAADIEKYGNRYSEKGLWRKLRRVARFAGEKVVYAVLLLYYTLNSPTISIADKSKIYGALGYFILPLDFVPDILPIIGYSDDITTLAYVIHKIISNITPEIKQQAQNKLTEWFGDYDQKAIKDILNNKDSLPK